MLNPAPLARPCSHLPSSPSHLHPLGRWSLSQCGAPLSHVLGREGPWGWVCSQEPMLLSGGGHLGPSGRVPLGGSPGAFECERQPSRRTWPLGMLPFGYTQPGAGFLVPRPLRRGPRGESFRKVPPAWASHTAYLRVHTCSGAEARLSVGCSCPLSPLRAVARMVYLLPGSRALRERGGWSPAPRGQEGLAAACGSGRARFLPGPGLFPRQSAP